MRRLIILTVILLSTYGVVLARPASAALTLGQRLSGRILLQVQSGGALWYVSPLNFQRYNLGTATTAPTILRQLSLAVSQTNLDSIPVVGSIDVGNLALRQHLSGRILRLSATEQMWYVSPLNLQRYDLGSAPYTVLRALSLGISDINLKLIPIAAGFSGPVTVVNGLVRSQRSVVTSRGTYVVDLMTLNIDTTSLKILTDTAFNGDCRNNCPILSLKSYVDRRHAVAGMHGTYFCPYDYASCAGKTGSYDFPVFNSFTGVMTNGGRIKYTSQPIIAFDSLNHPFFYPQTRIFTSYDDFLAHFVADSRAAGGVGSLRSAMSNGPSMIEGGRNVLNVAGLDSKQATVKSYRGALGWKGTTVYFIVVRGATVTDSAAVVTAMGLDYAINLDGGGSTAMYQNGAYVIGPGRNLPNALLLVP